MSAPVHAHGTALIAPDSQIVVFALLLCATWFYVRGVRNLWRVAGAGRGIPLSAAAAFAAGCLVLALALISPLDRYGGRLFAAHMLQHELLMLVAAPLLVLGRPLAAWSWALRSAAFPRVLPIVRMRAVREAWGMITAPLTAWSIHTAVLWVWHAPALFAAAQASELIHALQHASFLFSALLFWWAVLKMRPDTPAYGVSILYLFTTMIHAGALGALLAFSGVVWYPSSSGDAAAWGLTPLEDQQLGGLTMWIPGGFVYLAAAIAILFRWLANPPRGTRGVIRELL